MVVKEMKKEYRRADSEQIIITREFLEVFKNKPRKIEDDIRLYYRHYKQVSEKLVQRRQLDEYTQCS